MHAIFLVLAGLAFSVGIYAVIVALPVMLLWDWLMPVLFALKPITFWQALGLSLLCGFLFKGAPSTKSN